MKPKIKVGERLYDPNELEDAKLLETVLLPPEWPIEPREGVRLFSALQGIITHALSRHLANDFKNIVKIGMEQAGDGEDPTVKVGFNFDIDFRAIQVAAVGGLKMSFSKKFTSTSKPVTMDINQPELFDEDGNINDTGKLDEQMDPPEPPPEPVMENGEPFPTEIERQTFENLLAGRSVSINGDAGTAEPDAPDAQDDLGGKKVAKKRRGKKK